MTVTVTVAVSVGFMLDQFSVVASWIVEALDNLYHNAAVALGLDLDRDNAREAIEERDQDFAAPARRDN